MALDSLLLMSRKAERTEGLIHAVAGLLRELRDVSQIPLKPTETRILNEIQKGEHLRPQIAAILGVSPSRITGALRRVAQALRMEKERRARESAVVPFEERPIADLRLKWAAERPLGDVGIKTIGQLLRWSEAELMHVQQMGVVTISRSGCGKKANEC